MHLSMNAPVVLLWGIVHLFPLAAMSTPTPENNTHTTGEPHKTTKQLLTSANIHNETVTHHSLKPTESGVATTKEMKIATITNSSSDDRPSNLVVTTSVAATTSSLGGGLLHSSAAATTTEAKAPNSTKISETVRPTGDGLLQQSISPANTVRTSASSSATLGASLATFVPTTEPASTTKPDVTETFFPIPITPSDNSSQTPVSTQNQSTPSTSATTIGTKNTTSGVAPVFNSTIKEKSTTRTNPQSTSWPVSTTRIDTSTSEEGITRRSLTEPPTTVFSTNTTANSTSPVGIFIPHGPTIFPTHTTKPATTGDKSPPSTDSQPCSSHSVVKHCLIVIASLAGLATIFMVTTIILCAKLSTKKYRVKRPQSSTEMMCISSLLPERDYTYARQRNPVNNGVLVMHVGGDSDEELGDNLTLSSFLPENDHSV